jgi:hypothetical protein
MSTTWGPHRRDTRTLETSFQGRILGSQLSWACAVRPGGAPHGGAAALVRRGRARRRAPGRRPPPPAATGVEGARSRSAMDPGPSSFGSSPCPKPSSPRDSLWPCVRRRLESGGAFGAAVSANPVRWQGGRRTPSRSRWSRVREEPRRAWRASAGRRVALHARGPVSARPRGAQAYSGSSGSWGRRYVLASPWQWRVTERSLGDSALPRHLRAFWANDRTHKVRVVPLHACARTSCYPQRSLLPVWRVPTQRRMRLGS